MVKMKLISRNVPKNVVSDLLYKYFNVYVEPYKIDSFFAYNVATLVVALDYGYINKEQYLVKLLAMYNILADREGYPLIYKENSVLQDSFEFIIYSN